MRADTHDPIRFSPWVRRVAWLLIVLAVIVPVSAVLAPWQQHVAGSGRVVAFTPMDRPQDVQAPVSGRVVDVLVTEAQLVRAGDPLVQLVDIDPQKIERLGAKLEAARKDLQFTEQKVESLEAQALILGQARDLAVDAFGAKVEVAGERLRAARQDLRAAQAEHEFAAEQEKRIARLTPEFVEEIKHLEAKARLRKAAAAVSSAVADVDAAEASLRSARAEQGKERQKASAAVEGVRARAQGEKAKAAEIRAKIVDIEGDLRAQNAQLVRAPRDGRVFRLAVNDQSSIVKAGEVLLQIVPETSQPAAELWVRGMDAPLVEAGRRVRLQFEGWPAVQFVGWPSVAVGTFGGVVSLIDPTDNGQGQFRILVVPDPTDQAWPEPRWLRQGVRAKGWVLLDEVRLGFELWRQLNGFPPAVGAASPPEVRK